MGNDISGLLRSPRVLWPPKSFESYLMIHLAPMLTVTGTSPAPNLLMAGMPFTRILSILQPNLVQSRCPPQTPNSMVRSMVRHVLPQTLVLPVEDPWNKQLGDWSRNRWELGHSRRDVQAAVARRDRPRFEGASRSQRSSSRLS